MRFTQNKSMQVIHNLRQIRDDKLVSLTQEETNEADYFSYFKFQSFNESG